MQSDAISDLVADRADLAIRAGPLASSGLIARSLGETALVMVASPGWIKRHGMPATLADLALHDRLGFSYPRASGDWLQPARSEDSRVRVNDGEGIRQLALASVAPARLAAFTIRNDLASGLLVRLLPLDSTPPREAFHAIYVGRSDTLPQRVQVLLDELTIHGIVRD